ncbi:lipase family protein [Microbulbifer thermotolerans]|uniref:alpha/beta fold hydrolase n=1 Tax=Microbulbifer thermotolerans TaxID=252514 RepID=UPI00224B01B0|nr:alpha/beta fold hydrolase [Microbulbifer thermotolerans]MCX2781881.1 lipase family protein [Microbulbifer thermotolerans]
MKSLFSVCIRTGCLIPMLSVLYIASAQAGCVDNVVLVHGNTGSPSDWDNTYSELRSRGYSESEIYRPSWGSKTCAACNDHSGSEETPVRDAISSAIADSCTGKIDVIGHSMGVTLAAQQIIKLGVQDQVDAFVGVAGAYRGLWSCGTYPFNVYTSTCGSNGLSVSSPFLDWLYGKPIAGRVYSIKSWSDQIVCATGFCTVGGVHSSQIAEEDATYTYAYGHFGLQTYTYDRQVSLIQ